MNSYLSECFGEDITFSAMSFPESTPVYMKYGYTLEKCSWQNNDFVLITPKDDAVRLPVIKNHFYKIEEKIGLPCAMNLEWLTPLQRKNLIEDKIPFVSGRNQIYLPFWGCVFQEKYKHKMSVAKKMSPSTQLIFLWTYYSIRDDKKVNLSRAVSELHIPKTTVSRAFIELVEYGLIKQIQEGTTKWIEFADGTATVLNNAMSFLGSPTARYIYMKEVPQNPSYKIGGLKALKNINTTDRDGSIVFAKASVNKIPKDLIISKNDFDDFGGVVAEVWRYNPQLLSTGEQVDDISLILSLKDNEDERVQKEIDDIKEKYGLDV